MQACSKCDQFIRLNEPACPFCHAPTRAPRSSALSLGLGLLLGVGVMGCDDSKDPTETSGDTTTTTDMDNSAAAVTYGGAPPLDPSPRWIESGSGGAEDLDSLQANNPADDDPDDLDAAEHPGAPPMDLDDAAPADDADVLSVDLREASEGE